MKSEDEEFKINLFALYLNANKSCHLFSVFETQQTTIDERLTKLDYIMTLSFFVFYYHCYSYQNASV
jgi:hypothetical protein